MEIETLKLVYFSPTGTSRKVVEAIAEGVNAHDANRFDVERVDITTPQARQEPLKLSGKDLLILAVPVYMGRVPDLLGEWFAAMQADQTPAVCVVVYGNRAYENALLELKDKVVGQGCIPVAGAAYIGEHSFCNPEQPASLGRPHAEDLRHARAFGREVRRKLEAAESAAQLQAMPMPGEYPYGGITELWNVDFIEVSDACIQCGVCAEVCPMGAIDPHDSRAIDQVKCITCCACIKRCPQGARSMKPGPVKEAVKRLVTLYAEPKQPQCFV